MPAPQIELAHQKGIKIVMGELLSATGSRSRRALALQRFSIKVARSLAPAAFTARLDWDAYRLADAIIAMTAWEKHLMHYLFGAPLGKIVVVPNGVEELFSQAASQQRGPGLVIPAHVVGNYMVTVRQLFVLYFFLVVTVVRSISVSEERSAGVETVVAPKG